MTTGRILVEDCALISAAQLEDVELVASELPFAQTPVTFTESCPTCGTSVQFQFGAVRTRQGKRLVCPKCGRRVQNLYRTPQTAVGDWGCKECHGLAYSSQYQRKAGSRYGTL